MKAIELEKAYNPAGFEERVYRFWEEGGHFKPSAESAGEPFTVVIPPPNVTGVLHMGHALNSCLQDIAVRYRRMAGRPTLWVPGTDHAGIATQNVVERRLKAEGKTKRDVGRDEFLRRTWQVKDEHHAVITRQLRRIGASVDWSRERFTLDEGLSRAVREVFVALYERDLIYRGRYLVNWCTSCGTALADDEVEHEETAGFMYHIYYELEDGTGQVEIATTRPETLLGDTAVAVNPADGRYSHLMGRKLRLPLAERVIPVIADSFVDMEFGTGCVKITPAHDPNDWEAGQRHNLEVINILNPDGTLNGACPAKYQGMTIAQAREAVVADLEAAGLFKGKEAIAHSVGKCYRCHTAVEPYVSEQWFVRMRPLAEKALAAWKRGEVVFYPRKWENTYAHWLENIRDWCISRQLWWGHRIPVWYCGECGKMSVLREDPDRCPHCGSGSLRQDPDVLDTWFSSWLWPFSTLGWPDKTEDLERFYPTSALVTAYDIIFFWVSRMIMAGLEFTGKAPFRDVYIHGLVRDKKGRKMSKSLGNGIDPIEIVESYGSDALKFTLAFMCAQGQDVLVDKESFKFGSRFANKIWNASRYILGNLEGRKLIAVPRENLAETDRWIVHRLDAAAADVASALEGWRFNDGAQAVFEFFWNDFCDWYVEITKLSFKGSDGAEKDRAASVLLNVLEEALRLLHPFLPFVTEEIYRLLPENCRAGLTPKAPALIAADYPRSSPERRDGEADRRFAAFREVVRSIRALRAECGVDPAAKIAAECRLQEGSAAHSALERAEEIKFLAGLSSVSFPEPSAPKTKGAVGSVGEGFEVFILPGEGIDAAQLAARFAKELEKEKALAQKIGAKLANAAFAANAPAEVVAAEREKLEGSRRRAEKLEGYIRDLQ